VFVFTISPSQHVRGYRICINHDRPNGTAKARATVVVVIVTGSSHSGDGQLRAATVTVDPSPVDYKLHFGWRPDADARTPFIIALDHHAIGDSGVLD